MGPAQPLSLVGLDGADEERIWASVTIVLGMGVFLVDILVDLLARRRHADPLLAVVRLAACVRSSTSHK